MVTKGDRFGVAGEIDWGFGIGTCTLRYMELMVSGALLHSTENSTQYSVIIDVGKESEREWMCVRVYLNPLLHSRNCHKLVNQLYFKKTFKNEKKYSLKLHIFQISFPSNLVIQKFHIAMGTLSSKRSQLLPKSFLIS